MQSLSPSLLLQNKIPLLFAQSYFENEKQMSVSGLDLLALSWRIRSDTLICLPFSLSPLSFIWVVLITLSLFCFISS